MRGYRVVLACLLALSCFLAPARESWAGTQRDAICQGCGDGPGCTPCSSSDGSSSSSSNPGIAWGGMTKRNMETVGRDCAGKPLCFLVRGTFGLLGGAITDVPYYAVKGVGYGLYYGGKGLYLGARGLGKGLAYTGRSIGRGIAYPFNRPPKPKLPPTTWEQYKHDVLRHQKALTKANKANKANQRWCMSRVPLAVSANRAEWEERCNPGDAVSRTALPPDILAPAPAIVETAAVVGTPANAAPIVDAPAPATVRTPASDSAAKILPPPSGSDEEAASPTAAPTAAAPVPSGAPDTPTQAPDTAQNQAASQQQAVQVGVESEKAGLEQASAGFSDGRVAIGGASPSLLSQGKPLRILPSATPANSLTPSEYGFEGRDGYGVRYDQVWGKATPPDNFIERWNFIEPLTAMRSNLRKLAINKGTDYAQKSLIDNIKDSFADLLKRARGSTGIVDHVKHTQGGRSAVQNYSQNALEDSLKTMEAAVEGRIDTALELSVGQDKRLMDLQHEAAETVMGQVGDPMETLKETALEKTKENFPLTLPKKQSIRQATVCHMGEPLGIGCSKAKLIYSPQR